MKVFVMASLRRLATILVAFFAGNFLAVHVLLAGKVLSDFSNFGYYFKTEIWSLVAIYALTVLFGALTACLVALIPTLLVLAFAETQRVRRAWFYILAAGTGALFFDIACVRYDLIQMRSFCVRLSISELVIAAAAGMVGGYVFWRLAGSRAGEWGTKARSVALVQD